MITAEVTKWAFLDAVLCDISGSDAVNHIKSYQTPIEDAVKKPHLVSLFGYVKGHQDYDEATGRFEDGHRIITSRCASVHLGDMEVHTASGSVYKLVGSKNKEYTE